jgi:hypothetical protein
MVRRCRQGKHLLPPWRRGAGFAPQAALTKSAKIG